MIEGSLEEYLERFLSMRTDNTSRSYLQSWEDWTSYIAPTHPSDATSNEIINYITSLRERGLSDATLRHRFHSLRSIYGFLFDMEVVSKNPWLKAGRLISWRQHKQVRPTKLIDSVIIWRLIKSLKTSSLSELRIASLFALLFGGGLRRGEVRSLKFTHLTFVSRQMCVVTLEDTKGGVRAEQSLPAWATRYLYLYSKRVNDREQYLFSMRDGQPVEGKTIYRWYRSIMLRYGIDAGPHSARASAVTALKNQGVEDRDVARFLRHRTTHQVQVYDKRSHDVTDNPGLSLDYRKKVFKK